MRRLRAKLLRGFGAKKSHTTEEKPSHDRQGQQPSVPQRVSSISRKALPRQAQVNADVLSTEGPNVPPKNDEISLFPKHPAVPPVAGRSDVLGTEKVSLGADNAVRTAIGGTYPDHIVTPTWQEETKKALGLRDAVDTTIDEAVAPAATQETVHKETTELIQEEITRDIHEDDHYHYIQPIKQTEVLPTKHYIHDVNGNLVEIPGPVSGLEYHVERRW